MNTKAWFEARGMRYVRERAQHIVSRYGWMPAAMQAQMERCAARLEECGGAPTIFVPGSLLERYTLFFRRLSARGVEIAGHSYSHIDQRQCSTREAVEQNVRSARVFRDKGFIGRGFRCPYLSYTDELLAALPPGLYEYSSNRAISWESLLPKVLTCGGTIFGTLEHFYHPAGYETTLCMPRRSGTLLELPVIVPDDLQLLDGLQLTPERIAEHWRAVLGGTHARGEMFDLIFHLELASLWGDYLVPIVQEAKRLEPPVWVTRLGEISDWWHERMSFRVRQHVLGGRIALEFECSARGTVLARGMPIEGGSAPWDGTYTRLLERRLEPAGEMLPFLGIEEASPAVLASLSDQGYIVETGHEARRCSVVLSPDQMRGLTNEVELVNFIERAPGPLVKFNPWPDGAKSALALTGDLDALTVWDYTERLVGR